MDHIRRENAPVARGVDAALADVAATDSNASEPCREVAHKPKRLRLGTKRASMLRAFLDVGPAGLNCFVAALQHGDFVLRSSVSDLTHQYGIEFYRRHEEVPGRNSSRVHCTRYWLSPEGAARARELLGEEA